MTSAKKTATAKVTAFIGAGKMAAAIAQGMLKNGFSKKQIRACDVSEIAAKKFTAATGIPVSKTAADALSGADTVILAVKPQFAAQVLDSAVKDLKGKLLISIAAGLPLSFLKEHSKLKRVIRVMPNTPALVGEAMSCYAASVDASKEDIDETELILKSCGRCLKVQESLLDAVTGLSGSGPAFVIDFITGLADGGVYAGLPRETALELAIQTVLGTAKMCLESGKHPAELRDAVISPAGTTARGVMVLEKAGFSGIAANAVAAAAERSAELSKLK